METHRPLVLRRDAGGTMTLAEPIPDLGIMSLPALVRASTREWVIVELDGVTVRIGGHTFEACGWVGGFPPGVVLDHACCGPVL